MTYPKKVSDNIIISEYKRLGNLWKVAESVGLCGQSVHERLIKLGIERNLKHLTEYELKTVRDYYEKTPDNLFNQEELLKLFPEGMTKSRLEHIVTKIGVGNKCRKHSLGQREKESQTRKGIKPPHNGFSGFHHNEESKEKISIASKKNWNDPNFIRNTPDGKKAFAEIARINGRNSLGSNTYSRCKRGYYEIPGRGNLFFRSKWEANYALYLEFLKQHDQIISWEYEVKEFEFPVKKGVRFYKPDFFIITSNHKEEHHEVKGWMDDKSKTKIKRMRIYHPKVKLIVIGESEYKALEKYSRLLKWY